MNWIKKNCLSLIAIVVSAVAIFMSFRNDPIKVSLESAMLVSVATILSIPTAILIAWQIYQVYNVDKIINEKIFLLKEEAKTEIYTCVLELLSCTVSNSYNNDDYNNAIKILSFIPEYLKRGNLQNNAEVIRKQIVSINNVLDQIEKSKYKIDENYYNDFVSVFTEYPVFDLVLRRIKSIHQGSAL